MIPRKEGRTLWTSQGYKSLWDLTRILVIMGPNKDIGHYETSQAKWDFMDLASILDIMDLTRILNTIGHYGPQKDFGHYGTSQGYWT